MAIEAVHQGEHGPMRLTGEILAGVGCGLLVGVVLALIDVSVIGSISVVIAAIVGAMIGVSKPQWIQLSTQIRELPHSEYRPRWHSRGASH
jgi:hypothetical protein